jgi:hypothetical protein
MLGALACTMTPASAATLTVICSGSVDTFERPNELFVYTIDLDHAAMKVAQQCPISGTRHVTSVLGNLTVPNENHAPQTFRVQITDTLVSWEKKWVEQDTGTVLYQKMWIDRVGGTFNRASLDASNYGNVTSFPCHKSTPQF